MDWIDKLAIGVVSIFLSSMVVLGISSYMKERKVNAQILDQYRFSLIDVQRMPGVPSDPDENPGQFRVYHDNETGQEIVCVVGQENKWGRNFSCYLTGRRWN